MDTLDKKFDLYKDVEKDKYREDKVSNFQKFIQDQTIQRELNEKLKNLKNTNPYL